MNTSGFLIWKGKAVVKATIISMDMWYVESDLEPDQTDHSHIFRNIATKLNRDDVIKNPQKGMTVELNNETSSIGNRFLVLELKNSKLFMRLVSDEIADWVDKKLLEPWQNIDNAPFYENELKKELSFFHPLNWRKFRAIGIRTDCDDVLFELLTGNPKYAVVHLTWAKENSRKYPSTRFYKNWQDLYKNCIIKDHKEYNAGD